MPSEPSDVPGPALLIIEIGNSHVSLAVMPDDEVTSVQRMTLDELDALRDALEPAWETLPEGRDRAVVIGSVVPRLTERITELVEEELHTSAGVVGADVRVPLQVALESPASVGIDRLCQAVAAYDRLRTACVIASFGTATTIDCVNDDGVFLGGAILAGLGMQATALHEGTAQLPLVRLRGETTVYGQNTEEAINNGLVHGAIGALRELTERYATDLNHWPHLVVTGGFGGLIGERCDFVDSLVLDLGLRGIALAYRRHVAARPAP